MGADLMSITATIGIPQRLCSGAKNDMLTTVDPCLGTIMLTIEPL